MNIIKGLIIKDFLLLKSYKKNFLFSILIYALIIFMNSNDEGMSGIGAIMIMFLFSVYTLATFNYDEKSKSDRYILTFPLTKKEIVISKYILCIVTLLLGAFIGTLFGILIPYFTAKVFPDLMSYITTILAGITILSFMQSIQIPCIYKYGAEKGRTQIYIIMMILALIIGGFFMLFPNIDLSSLNTITNYIPFILVLITIINYFISYKISIKIYIKKEI